MNPLKLINMKNLIINLLYFCFILTTHFVCAQENSDKLIKTNKVKKINENIVFFPKDSIFFDDINKIQNFNLKEKLTQNFKYLKTQQKIYEYNQNFQIIKNSVYSAENHAQIIEETQYQYDNKNLLVNELFFYQNKLTNTYTYQYNEKNKIIEAKTYQENEHLLKFIMQYKYDSNGKLMEEKWINLYDAPDTSVYYYDSYGNVIKKYEHKKTIMGQLPHDFLKLCPTLIKNFNVTIDTIYNQNNQDAYLTYKITGELYEAEYVFSKSNVMRYQSYYVYNDDSVVECFEVNNYDSQGSLKYLRNQIIYLNNGDGVFTENDERTYEYLSNGLVKRIYHFDVNRSLKHVQEFDYEYW